MAIKDQCESCRFDNGNDCPGQSTSFDGTCCYQYVKKIDLQKEETQNQSDNLTQNYSDSEISEHEYPNIGFSDDEIETPSDENIHGWLKFFLIFFVGIGSVATVIMSFVSFEKDANFWLAYGDIIYSIIYLVAGILTIVAFYKRDTDAVFLAKSFVIFCFFSNLFAIIGSEPNDLGGSKAIAQMVRSMFWCLIWFIFLFKSNQVKELIPKTYRKSKTRDWILIGAMVLLPFIFIGMGIASERNSHIEAENQAVANLSLAPNQFTDGRIVLTIPYGTDCDENMADNLKIFTISDPETGSEFTVVSDYDNDITKRNFNQYWRSWKPDDLNQLEYEVITDDKQTTDNITVFYKLSRVKLEDPVDWEFALVFDEKTGKVCLISGYSSAMIDSPISYLINNLKFL